MWVFIMLTFDSDGFFICSHGLLFVCLFLVLLCVDSEGACQQPRINHHKKPPPRLSPLRASLVPSCLSVRPSISAQFSLPFPCFLVTPAVAWPCVAFSTCLLAVSVQVNRHRSVESCEKKKWFHTAINMTPVRLLLFLETCCNRRIPNECLLAQNNQFDRRAEDGLQIIASCLYFRSTQCPNLIAIHWPGKIELDMGCDSFAYR